MKKIVLLLTLIVCAGVTFGQKVDSIYFHLYTDSLKKGQHNYINVDGKLSDGRWQPLTSRELQFHCATATFEGNQLVIPPDFKDDKVVVKAALKANPAITIQRTIWIKQLPDPPLPGRDQVSPDNRPRRNRRS